MPHLVVSLASNEGFGRRQRLTFPHEIIEAQPAPIWLTLLGRYKKHLDAIRSGCYSHYLAWQELVRLGVSGVVLEDDAQRVRPDITYSEDMFPMDGFTLLGGAIRTSGAWARESSEFVESGTIMDVLASLRPGVNPVQGFRWTNSIAYFLPLNVAKQLIALVDAKPKMRIIDIWLNSQKVPQYLMYPNVFIDSDSAVSQLGSEVSHSKIDLYICAYMRKAMQQKGFTFPVRGGDYQVLSPRPELIPSIPMPRFPAFALKDVAEGLSSTSPSPSAIPVPDDDNELIEAFVMLHISLIEYSSILYYLINIIFIFQYNDTLHYPGPDHQYHHSNIC